MVNATPSGRSSVPLVSTCTRPVFMGDRGVVSRRHAGGDRAITGQVLIRPLHRHHLVLEVASDVIQVASFKLRGKRRLPDGSASTTISSWAAGTREDHDALLDSWGPGRHARGDALRRLRSRARSVMAGRVVQLDRLTADGVRDGALSQRSVTGARARRSGKIALARFSADAGSRVTVYGRPARCRTGRAIELLVAGRRASIGPDVEPATTWAEADLIATSPSINPTSRQPNHRCGRRCAPGRLGSSGGPDPLRRRWSARQTWCCDCAPCPTIWVTGTKGKTTTSSLIAALLADDPAHPVVLGGTSGVPTRGATTDLTAEHRVVIEAVRTAAADPGRAGPRRRLHERHADTSTATARSRPTQGQGGRLAEMVDPNARWSSTPTTRSWPATPRGATAPWCRTDEPARRPRLGVVDGWIVADAW